MMIMVTVTSYRVHTHTLLISVYNKVITAGEAGHRPGDHQVRLENFLSPYATYIRKACSNS